MDGDTLGKLAKMVASDRNLMTVMRATGLYGPVRRLYHSRYRRQRLEFYSFFLKPNDLCFDVGTNIGTRLQTFLELGARVVAIEPQSLCFTYLQNKYASNPMVHLVHAGLDDHEGTETIYLSENDALSSMSRKWIGRVKTSGRFSKVRWEKSEDVRVMTLDGLIDQFGMPSFCKIDVEGLELRVIQGLSRRIPCISFEFNPETPEDTEDAIRHLMSIGDYRFNHCLGEPTGVELKEWTGAERMLSLLRDIRSEGDVLAKI